MNTSTTSKPVTTRDFFSGLGLGATVKKVDVTNFDLTTTHVEVIEGGVSRLDKQRSLVARFLATVDYNLGFEVDFSGTFIARPLDGKGRDNIKEEIEYLRDSAATNVAINNSQTEVTGNYCGVDSGGEMLVVLKSMQAISMTESISLGCEEGMVSITDEKGTEAKGLSLSLNESEEGIASGWLMQEINNTDDHSDKTNLHSSFRDAIFDELLRMVAIAC